MSSNTNEPDNELQHLVRNPEVVYEPTDMSVRGVLGFLIGLAVAGALIIVIVWGVYRYIAGGGATPPTGAAVGTGPMATGAQRPGAPGDPALNFPNPRLQPDPVADLNKFRVREEEILNSYGWVDQANQRVHIPIEQAIQKLAEQGLPVRPGAAPPELSNIDRGAAGGINVSKVEDQYEQQQSPVAGRQSPEKKQSIAEPQSKQR